jgi:hypothetical protein
MLDLGFPAGARVGDDGATALHSAAYSGSPGTVRVLLDCGADIEARDTTWDSTPLVWAMVGSGERPRASPGPTGPRPSGSCWRPAPPPRASSCRPTMPRPAARKWPASCGPRACRTGTPPPGPLSEPRTARRSGSRSAAGTLAERHGLPVTGRPAQARDPSSLKRRAESRDGRVPLPAVVYVIEPAVVQFVAAPEGKLEIIVFPGRRPPAVERLRYPDGGRGVGVAAERGGQPRTQPSPRRRHRHRARLSCQAITIRRNAS